MKLIAMPPRAQRLAKESAWIITGQVLAVIGSLVLVRMLTEYLQPAQYGELALGLTLAGLVNQVVLGGVIASAGRFYSVAAERSDFPSYLAATRLLTVKAIWALAIGALLLILSLYWFGYAKWLGLAMAALVFAVSSGIGALFASIQNAARLRSLVASFSCLDAWLKVIISLGFIHWVGSSSTAVVTGFAVSSLLLTVTQWYSLARCLPTFPSTAPGNNHWKNPMQAYAWPFSTWGGFTWLQQASDRWALQYFVGESSVGEYTVVFQLGYVPIGIVTTIVVTLASPILYQRMGSGDDAARRASGHKLAWTMTCIGLGATGVAFFAALQLHQRLFSLFVADTYASVSYLLPWVVLAGGIFAAGQILALKLMSELRPTAMTIAKITTAVGGIGMNVWAASRFGTAGVVASLVSFSLVYFIWMALLARQPASSAMSPILPIDIE